MKRASALALMATAALSLGVGAEGITPPRKADDAETVALKAQVAELQRRLASLEQRVEEINKPRMQKAYRDGELPVHWDRVEPGAVQRAAKGNEPTPPVFPAERR